MGRGGISGRQNLLERIDSVISVKNSKLEGHNWNMKYFVYLVLNDSVYNFSFLESLVIKNEVSN